MLKEAQNSIGIGSGSIIRNQVFYYLINMVLWGPTASDEHRGYPDVDKHPGPQAARAKVKNQIQSSEKSTWPCPGCSS